MGTDIVSETEKIKSESMEQLNSTTMYNDMNYVGRVASSLKKIGCIPLLCIAQTAQDKIGSIFDGVRYLNQKELEKCQCVPSGYTKCLTRNEAADVLGDGWNIDVITWFFSGLKE